MSNMSYCRFENTARDFDDCASALEDLQAGGSAKLSRSEFVAAVRLVNAALDLVTNVAETAGVDLEDLTERNVEQALTAMQNAAEENVDG